MRTANQEFTINNPPPEGSKDLGLWVYYHFIHAYQEKQRLGLMDRWKENYKLYRGDHWGQFKTDSNKVSVNLYFANVQRTVANITARNPVVEVVDTDGVKDGADQVLSAKVSKWWHETEQQSKLARTSQNAENYGIGIEKPVWFSGKRQGNSVLVDPFAFFPAPGVFEDLQDAPYIDHAFAMDVEAAEDIYGVAGITPDPTDVWLGIMARENLRPNVTSPNMNATFGNSDLLTRSGISSPGSTIGSEGKCLIIEMWFRDWTVLTAAIIDEVTGEVIQPTRYKYPDGIRVVTVTNSGNVVLDDMPNPNINFALPLEAVRNTYAWGKYSFLKINAYEDTTSIWGFSAAEQVGPLNKKIDEIVSRLISYVNRAMFPPLRVDKGAGITKDMISSQPNLVLMPTRPNARIEFIPVPNLPDSFFRVLDVLIGLHDRIYQIEDADRGVAPKGVIAASAIAALQERNAVLIQHKIRALEYVARERGRWEISFLQNFATKEDQVEVAGEPVRFIGVSLVGRKFNYRVEAGSTVAKTSAQEQEQAIDLFNMKVIDRRAVLEILKITNWKQIIERMGEDQLGFFLQGLMDAGLSENGAQMLREYLMQQQANMTEPEKMKAESGTMQQATAPGGQK